MEPQDVSAVVTGPDKVGDSWSRHGTPRSEALNIEKSARLIERGSGRATHEDRSTIRPVDARWVESSYSGTGGGECVEVAVVPGTVPVHDSERHGHGPMLRARTAGPRSWRTRERGPGPRAEPGRFTPREAG
ncbi:DUF397 domain-containing protein [Streptomyces sp. Ru87]|uniref:DUF397 domain-containing protein n=1 Tax=Streptomyces sp. Ru87 TaxID=2044307 RepID=UPI00211D817E|nr:DUF397 domain-containing protein [Streptomyces sp. Ru87]